MRKADIEKFAKRKRAEVRGRADADSIAPDAPARKRTQPGAVNLAPETIQALAEAVAVSIGTKMARLLPVVARIAAADTLHTCERGDTVLRHAIDEGIAAANLMEAIL